MARFRVYNPSQTLADKLQAKEFTKIEFYAGYRDNSGLVFSGEVMQTIGGHETATDTFVDIFAADHATSYNKATVNKTLSAGYTPQDKAQVAIDAMAPYGTQLGLVNVDLSQPKFPRGLPMVGMARDVLRQVAFLKGALWSIQNGSIHIIDHTKPVQSDTIVMNAATGMIGWPRQTIDGIIVTSLLNPRLQPHVNLKIDPKTIIQAEQNNNPFTGPADLNNVWLNKQNVTSGIYNVFKINRHGDTRANDWYDESWCVGAGADAPPSASAQHYYVGTN